MEIASGRNFPGAPRPRRREGVVRASAWPAMSRSAAPWAKRRQTSRSTERRRDDPDRYPVERAGPSDRMRRSWPTSSACRPSVSMMRGDTDKIPPTDSAPEPARPDPDRRRSRPARHPRSRQQAEENWRPSAGDKRAAIRISDGRIRIAGTDPDQFCRSRRAPRRRSLEAEGSRDLRPGRRHLPERHPSRRSRDRSGDRHHQNHQLRHRRRFRRDAQPAAARRSGPWRGDAGHWTGADGAGGLRRG